MAPKQKVASKQKSPAGGGGSREAEWVRSQLSALEEQRRGGPQWLEEHHLWQEEQLQELLERINNGTVSTIPGDVLEGVEFYVSQELDEDAFYIDRELYGDLLAPAGKVETSATYVRRAASPEEVAAAATLQDWTDTSVKGISSLKKMLEDHAASPTVQEAGVARLSVLIAEASKVEGGTDNAVGLSPATVLPIVVDAMSRFFLDAGVQRAGCSAMRNITVMEGGCKVVADARAPALAMRAVKEHVKDVDVCRSGVSVIYAVIQKSQPTSLERISLKGIDAHQIMAAALGTHPNDRGVDRACRVAMPEVK